MIVGEDAGRLFFEEGVVVAEDAGVDVGEGGSLVAEEGLEGEPVSGLEGLPAEAGVPLIAVLVAAFAALMPAMQAYRTEVADLLSQP